MKLMILLPIVLAGAGCWQMVTLEDLAADLEDEPSTDDRSREAALNGTDGDSSPEGDADVDDDGDSDTDGNSDADGDSDADGQFDPDTRVPQGCEGAIEFPAWSLSDAVRNAAGLRNGDIYYEDVRNIQSLEAGMGAIDDLEGLQCLTSLTVLHLYGNRISDISALSHLTDLRVLGLANNLVSDVSALSGLINLTEISLDDNDIADITPLVMNRGIAAGDTVGIGNNLLDCDDPGTLQNIWILVDREIALSHDCEWRLDESRERQRERSE